MSTDETPRIQLLWSPDCPNVEAARRRLEAAFDRLEISPDWISRNIDSPKTPCELRRYGSPTILVDGDDVAKVAPDETDGDCCRIYRSDGQSYDVAPELGRLVEALRVAGFGSRIDDAG